MKKLYRDLVFLAGCGLALYGLWQFSRPLACIIGGAVLAAFSFILPKPTANG